MQRRLLSGLTATIELETKVEADGVPKAVESISALEIRYEVWEEVLLVRCLDCTGTFASHSFKSFDQMKQWLSSEPIKVASIREIEPDKALHIKVKCHIIPYSKAEEGEARDWFSKLLNVPEPGSTSQADRDRKRRIGGQPSANSLFSTLMSSGIGRQSVRSYEWEWESQRRLR